MLTKKVNYQKKKQNKGVLFKYWDIFPHWGVFNYLLLKTKMNI